VVNDCDAELSIGGREDFSRDPVGDCIEAKEEDEMMRKGGVQSGKEVRCREDGGGKGRSEGGGKEGVGEREREEPIA